jgi:hypothetical protein
MFNRIQPFLEGAGDKSCMCNHREASSFVSGLPMEDQYGAVHVAKNLSEDDYEGQWQHEENESPYEERKEDK